jgi:hypothetical protein
VGDGSPAGVAGVLAGAGVVVGGVAVPSRSRGGFVSVTEAGLTT